MVSSMGKDYGSIQQGIVITVSGKMEKFRESGSLLFDNQATLKKIVNIRDRFKISERTVLAGSIFKMEIILKEFIGKTSRMVRGRIDGRTVQYIRASFLKENVMDWVS